MSRGIVNLAAVAVLVAGTAFIPTASAGGHVGWSVSIGGPGYAISVGEPGYWGGSTYGHYRPWHRPVVPAPVLYPAPVYAPAPVVYPYAVPVPRVVRYAAPAWAPRRVYFPAPVVTPPLVYYGRY
jgi:hypothetical protein